jgi:hypothetical protein
MMFESNRGRVGAWPAWALAAGLAGLVAGCSGGGSGTAADVDGLTVPENMSVVKAQEEGAAKPVPFKTDFAGLAKAFNAADTQYTTDPVATWVYDPSIQPLDLVNMILCLMDQTRADQMVNQGTYLALVDYNRCQQGSQGGGGDSGQSASGGKGAKYWNFIVNSTRASNSAPQIVEVWISGIEPDGPDAGDLFRVDVETTITEGVSDTNPFGSFTMNYAFPDGVGGYDGGGTLKTMSAAGGQVAFTVIEKEGTEQVSYSPGESFHYTAGTVEMTPDGLVGRARTVIQDEGNDGGFDYSDGGAFGITFDANHMRRAEADDATDLADEIFSSDTCLARGTYNTQVWRYDLYHAADGTWKGDAVTGGERVEVNSGFPFTYDDSGDTVYGHIGYWGMWVEDPSVVIADGATIQKVNFSTGATTPYTVVKAPGKLIRRTAMNLALSKLVGETLQYWGEVDDGGGARFSQWQVAYNGSAFLVTAEITGFDETGPVTSAVSPAVDITPATSEWLGLWSDSLGGDVNYVGGDANVTFYSQEFVGPDDAAFDGGALTLHCVQRCLKADIGASDVATWDGVYGPDAAFDLSSGVTDYAIDPADMTLTLGGNDVALVAGVDTSGTEHDWGMSTGEMVTSAVLATMTDASDLWNPAVVTVTYRWETGSNDWNKFVGVKDASDVFASFDEPIQFAYEHATANDLNGDSTHDGKTFRLNYGGNGDLWGIPSAPDPDTGRWYSLFSIKDGTVMGPTGTEFVVKGREREQSMAEDAGQCTALTLTAPAAALPTEADAVPDIGTMPEVTDAPAVIDGELQTAEAS